MTDNHWRTRWTKDPIKALLIEQFDAFWRNDTGVERSRLTELIRASSLPHAVVVSGLRRAGKSTLLAQMAHRLGENTFYFIGITRLRGPNRDWEDCEYFSEENQCSC